MNAEARRIQIVAAGDAGLAAGAGEPRAAIHIERPAGQDLRVVPTAAAHGIQRPWRLSEALHLRPRQGLFLLVLALHAGVMALLLMPHAQQRLAIALPSIEAQIIAATPSHTEAPPLPPLALERPHVDLITPDVAITEPAPEAPTAAPAESAASAVAAMPAKASPGPPEPVTPPRFDAAYLKNPPPTYPTVSRRLHEQGTVLMRVRVSPQGEAVDVLIERTSGSQRLDDAAMQAVRLWRFLPAHRGTQPVEAWVLVPVEFELQR